MGRPAMADFGNQKVLGAGMSSRKHASKSSISSFSASKFANRGGSCTLAEALKMSTSAWDLGHAGLPQYPIDAPLGDSGQPAPAVEVVQQTTREAAHQCECERVTEGPMQLRHVE